jgi:hypothetical protein
MDNEVLHTDVGSDAGARVQDAGVKFVSIHAPGGVRDTFGGD